MPKYILLLPILSLLAATAQAAEYGLSVSLNRAEVSIPINLSPQLRIEPSFFYARDDFQTNFDTLKNRVYVLKTGVFSIRPVSEGINILSGLRIGYELDQRVNESSSAPRDDSAQGFIIEPALAVEYFPVTQLALGAEVALNHTRLFAKEDTGFDSTSTRIVTSINVKYFY